MRRLRLALAAALAATLIIAAPVGAAGATRPAAQTDATTHRATVDRSLALVELKGAPLATYSKTSPTQGKKIDFSAAA